MNEKRKRQLIAIGKTRRMREDRPLEKSEARTRDDPPSSEVKRQKEKVGKAETVSGCAARIVLKV